MAAAEARRSIVLENEKKTHHGMFVHTVHTARYVRAINCATSQSRKLGTMRGQSHTREMVNIKRVEFLRTNFCRDNLAQPFMCVLDMHIVISLLGF